MTTVFVSALQQMLVLFLIVAVGYFLKKKNLIGENASKVLSDLEVYVFCPCLLLITFTNNFTLDMLAEKSILLCASTVITIFFSIPFSRMISKRIGRTDDEQAVYSYSLCFSNFGYLGYPIVQAVFGEVALMNMMIFCIPINLAIYSYGLYTLLPQKGFSYKQLLKPFTIAPFVGILLIIFKIELPDALNIVLDNCGKCMAPVAMILTGIVLAKHPLKDMFFNVRAYIGSVLRLIAMPAFVGCVMYFLKIRGEVLLLATTTLAMPFGLNSVIFPEAFGGDATTGTQVTFISNLMGIITIPIMLSLFYAMAY